MIARWISMRPVPDRDGVSILYAFSGLSLRLQSVESHMRTTMVKNRQNLRPKGFTLIELLVVISIIALLVAVFLPALSKARAVARKVQCQTHMRQVYIAGQAYTVNWNYYPASTVSYPGGFSSTFAAMFDYTSVGLKDYRKHPVSNMFWACPANPVQGSMAWQDVRNDLAYASGSVNIGNYWTTHYFGMSASSFDSVMVPIDMVPATRKKDPKPAQSLNEIVWLGELRGVTYARWTGGAGNMVFFHPEDTSHVVMMDGSFNDVTGNPITEGLLMYK